ncbi:sporulation-specific diadenylate cyclase CdaS [Bacillus sp. JJ1533]|uniref:sporulation-specific diadenylate cyclase CdaS n=1 Tax=Bacillus sp. JJ1533 TaxID=3122959 RepID=UPI002FFD8714
MIQNDCDVSPLKQQLVSRLQDVTKEIDQVVAGLDNENNCLLGRIEGLKEKFEAIETAASSFYLNCYLSPFVNKFVDISSSIQHLSSLRHGALIVIERKDLIDSYIKPGTFVGANLTAALLESIFFPGNPLHDGAVLVRSDQIYSAANVLPLSKVNAGEKKLGTRHRAAIGLTEQSDALVLIVSEETGRVSFAIDGNLYPIITSSSLI